MSLDYLDKHPFAIFMSSTNKFGASSSLLNGLVWRKVPCALSRNSIFKYFKTHSIEALFCMPLIHVDEVLPLMFVRNCAVDGATSNDLQRKS